MYTRTGVKIPFQAWYDVKNFRSRIDYFDGEVQTYQLPHGKLHTSLYKINPASDILNDWKFCHALLRDGTFYQPAIPININRGNGQNTTMDGIPCVKFSETSISGTTTIILHYYVRYENSMEIPVRYEKLVQYPTYTRRYYLDYIVYEPVVSISAKMFDIDPMITDNCHDTTVTYAMNPIKDHVMSVDYPIYAVHAKTFNSLVNRDDKNYNNIRMEAKYRQRIFRRNLKLIEAANHETCSYKLGVNKFTDRTYEEFSLLLGARDSPSQRHNGSQVNPPSASTNRELPDHLDYRSLGLVTPVKDQMWCGSCYIFAAVAALESAYLKKFGNSVDLSEQSLLECATWNKSPNRGGCIIGSIWRMLSKIRELGGVPLTRDYYRQYSALEGKCQWKNASLFAQIKIIGVPNDSIIDLKEALVEHGPIAVTAFTSYKFRFYTSGVFDDPQCLNNVTNHGMLLVGYGKENGKSYWLLKNSWGKDWGDHGYIKISQENNVCGILNNTFYVVL